MTRRIFFQIHWFLGITAGLVLAVMGVTGAMLSFEDEIMAAISPGIVTLTPGTGAPLAPDAIIVRASAQRDGLRVASLTVEDDPALAWRVQFDPVKGKGRRGERSYVDPRDGRLLGAANGTGFFRTITDLHRWLALPGGGNGIGRQITAFSAIALIFFALSGLYLRWPRRALDWRAWLVLDLRKSGRNLYRALHAVIGGWIVLFYLLSATTGLWWSYDWYRQGVLYTLTGKTSRGEEPRGDRGEKMKVETPSLALAWPALEQATGGHFESVTITLPKAQGPVGFRVLLPDARHERMTDMVEIDPANGRVLKVARYADKSVGEVITTSMLEVHRGAIFGMPGRLFLFVTSLTMPLFTITGFLLYFARRRRKRPIDDLPVETPAAAGASDLLVAYASQTGGAERLARQTAAALGTSHIVPLASVDADQLAQVDRALFVISTYGEGEPPDRVRRFARQDMAEPPAAGHLHYAVLALGDREYADFCAFGHQVDRWLHAGGGQRLFDMIEVDGEDADAHRQWQQQLAALGARADAPDWAPADYAKWRLMDRRLLNPGSAGGPAYLIALKPCDGVTPDWEAGDIAEILPRNDPQRVAALRARHGEVVDAEQLATSILPADEDAPLTDLRPLPHREYSVASIASDGRIELLVRQVRRDDGWLGLGSGWLTRHAPVGSEIDLRVHANPGFHAPADGRRLILIGNGTGLAGLRGHLRQAAARGVGGHWLFLGERSAAHDAFLGEELEQMLADGTLSRLDRAFSRDPACGRYVQHLVEAQAEALRLWVEQGAAILVCGSLEGMAPAVDAALRAALGDDRLEAMAETGLYRRDIY
ncbi:PepSY domain-containing protein [Sphingobium rhizovicinum]|uniref:PepSY domain-containing protein n=1 Tax=Sphingobium rhizovicinum TaxID=432308 RepID=A0ABV7NJE0_9SPHN